MLCNTAYIQTYIRTLYLATRRYHHQIHGAELTFTLLAPHSTPITNGTVVLVVSLIRLAHIVHLGQRYIWIYMSGQEHINFIQCLSLDIKRNSEA